MVVVVDSVAAIIVVVMDWSLNLTSAMCTHSIRSPDGLVNSMKYWTVLLVICRGMETLVREVQLHSTTDRPTLSILSNILMN